MTLKDGSRLGSYEILSPLGAGGMGEVYRARDTKLNRDAAIKVLPAAFAQDETGLARLRREAQVLASLNHPHIASIYGLEELDGLVALALEFVEGEDLSQRLARGAIPVDEAIAYARQIAEGLEGAHEKGVVHRDLKPANIKVTKQGVVKILDFGLAKARESEAGEAGGDPSKSPTLARHGTQSGVIMGTAAYMSPEQARGRSVDKRADIWAFGVVLFEMLTGRRLFPGETLSDTLAAVLKSDPDWTMLPPATPAGVRRLLRRCLERETHSRLHDIADARLDLEDAGDEPGPGEAGPTASRRSPIALWLTLGLVLPAVAAATWFIARRPITRDRVHFAIPVPGEVSQMVLSRDGTMLAFVSPNENGIPMLFVQHVGSSILAPLLGTQDASYPFFSPDGTYVGFFAHGKLQKMPSAGGAPQVLADALAGRGGSWGVRDVILFAPDASAHLWSVNADGSGFAPVTRHVRGEEQTHRWPVFLPDGSHFLFWSGNFGNEKNDPTSGIYLSSLDGKDKKLVVLCHSSFGYDATHLYFADAQRRLVGLAFDTSSATVSGSANGVATSVGFQTSTYWAAFAVSGNGTLVYNTSVGAALSALTWMDRAGKELGRIGEPAVMANPTLSPDGARVAVDISDEKANNVDIWLEGTSVGGSSRFTFDPAEEVTGVWSRDGGMLAYRATLTPGVSLLLKPASGLEHERILKFAPFSLEDDILPNSWSLDGQQILCTHQTSTNYYLDLVPAAGGTATRFLKGTGNETNGMISPDGKWVAYASDESGHWEIYATSFPGAAGKWQVSRGGGREPRWRDNGKEIFAIAPDGMLMAIPVGTDGGFLTGVPVPLFQVRGRAAISSTDVFTYDVARGGQRFLVNRYVKPDHVPPLTIVLNAARDAAP